MKQTKNSQETDTAEVTERLSTPEKSRPDTRKGCGKEVTCLMEGEDFGSCVCGEFCFYEPIIHLCKKCQSQETDFKKGAKAERERILKIIDNYFKIDDKMIVDTKPLKQKIQEVKE